MATQDSKYKGKEVSCRVLGMLFQQLKRQQISPDVLIKGVPYSLKHLTNKYERISWKAYRTIIQNATEIWSQEEFVEIGQRSVNSLAFRPLNLIMQLFLEPRQLYHFATRQDTESSRLNTSLEATVEDLGPHSLICTIALKDGFPPCPDVFYLNKGALMAMPLILGYPYAEISMDLSPRKAIFELTLPFKKNLVSRIKRWFRTPLNFRFIAQELRESHEVLLVRNQKLEAEIQERKLVEKELRESKQFAESLIGNLMDGIIVADEDFRIISVNPSFCKITGFSKEELVGLTPPFPYWPKDNDAQIKDDISKVKRSTNNVFRRHLRHKDGHPVPVIISFAKIHSKEKKGTHLIVSFKDNTFQQQVEDALIEAKNSLKKQVERRTKALTKSNHSLERFAFLASHDLQEPLRMITSYLQLLSKRLDGRLSEKELEYLLFAVDGAKRMRQLLDGILQYSRIKTHAKPFVEVDILEVVNDVLANLEVSIEETGASIQYEDLPHVQADPNQMLQLFQNLISNGIKFQANHSSPQIKIQSTELPDAYQFSISDNGIGIAEDYRSQIFDIFKRLHTREEYSGNGVGLSICQEIVERHEGKIWVESAPEKGSTFSFTIPK